MVQLLDHFWETVNVTVSPSKLLIVIGVSRYLVLPSEPVSTAPIWQTSVGEDDGEYDGYWLGLMLGETLGDRLSLGFELGASLGAFSPSAVGPMLGKLLGTTVG